MAGSVKELFAPEEHKEIPLPTGLNIMWLMPLYMNERTVKTRLLLATTKTAKACQGRMAVTVQVL
jgi:hypothetical protein